MKYELVLSSKFKKSFKKLSSDKNFDRDNFDNIIEKLLKGKILDKKYKNHKLKGEYSGCMECHLQNDILLIYYFIENELVLYGVDIGSHSKLF
jgi:mRNA interferase YafQ